VTTLSLPISSCFLVEVHSSANYQVSVYWGANFCDYRTSEHLARLALQGMLSAACGAGRGIQSCYDFQNMENKAIEFNGVTNLVCSFRTAKKGAMDHVSPSSCLGSWLTM
jgi:hypothetical protein